MMNVLRGPGRRRVRAALVAAVTTISLLGFAEVAHAAPAITTTASPDITLGGGSLSDAATVSGLVNPVSGAGAGTVTFVLYGPNDATCATPIFTSSNRPITLDSPTSGTATSAAFAPTAAGTYRWIASYSGDVNNAPVSGVCGDPAEQTIVSPAAPAITTTASPDITLGGGSLSDTATVTGLVNPVSGAGAGTVEFRLYGPNDATCSTVIFTSSNRPITLNGPQTSGTATSAAFTPTAAGTYRWRAFYSGDSNNAPVSGPCNAANEQTIVSRVTPTLTTNASAGGPVGTQIKDTATLAGGMSPSGTITFSLYANSTCTGAPVFTSSVPVSGNGSYDSGNFTPTAPGTYRWVASYSGDTNNDAAGPTACLDPAEDVEILALPDDRPAEVLCNGKVATIVGTERRDSIRGTRGADVIAALGGNDSIRSGSGEDVVCGSEGDDVLVGGLGADLLRGGAGQDELRGARGPDSASGGTGSDQLRGNRGDDALSGGSGADECGGGAGTDEARGCEVVAGIP